MFSAFMVDEATDNCLQSQLTANLCYVDEHGR